VCDTPLIRYAVALLRGHGIQELVVNLHHHGEQIAEDLGDGRALGVQVRYSREETILGTGGGIRHALPLLDDGEPLVVVNGKVVVDLDLEEVLARHRASGAAATLVVRRDANARRWNAIDAPDEGGPIRGIFGEGAFMFTGIHVIQPELVARLPDDGAERCIIRQGYVPWMEAGLPIHAHVMDGTFLEHSTPERYLQGNFRLLGKGVSLAHPPGRLSGIDPAAESHPEAEIVEPVLIAPGAQVGAYAVVGPDVVVGSHALVTAGVRVKRTVMWPRARLAQDLEGAIVTPTQRVRVTHPASG
jgi:NDP-sugar pyrophosphorylase family protein